MTYIANASEGLADALRRSGFCFAVVRLHLLESPHRSQLNPWLGSRPFVPDDFQLQTH